MKFWGDTETFSEVPITHGAHAYAEKAEVMLFSWAIDDGPVFVWDATLRSQPPVELTQALEKCDEHWFHNWMFDGPVVKHALPEVHARMPEQKRRDTLVQGLCHGLPGKLDTLCEIFGLPQDLAKDKRGRQLISIFCKYQPKNQKLRRKTRETHPVEWEEFKEYAKSDIRAMRELHKKMPKWNYPNNKFELDLWHLDQRINMGGVYADLELCRKAVEAVEVAQAKLAEQTQDATDGAVTAATQRDKLLEYILASHGVVLPDMRADTLERRLSDESLPDAVRELIGIRLAASTSSTSKFKRFLNCASSDGFVRGTLQFSGAQRTQRWAGRLIQPQNFLRPTLKQSEIEAGIEAVKAGCADLVTDNVMELTANMMRSVIIAPPGKKLVVADLSNIEGRAAAWLAGEDWKLKAFQAYDEGTGMDLYIAAYCRAFNCSPEEAVRQVGKVMELMLQYEGGVGAFLTGAATYRINLEDLASAARETIPARVWADALNFLGWSKDQKRNTFGLSDDAFVTCDSLKRLWRSSNSAISSYWPELKNAATEAILNPNREVECRKVAFVRQGNWLRMLLPSGDCLAYPSPRVGEDGSISYMGINQYSRKWQRVKTYGGKMFENLCQKFARNVMAHNMPAIQEAGYDIKLTVHDELITYAPDTPEYSAEGLSALLATGPKWASDLPLAAAGYEAYRYKKD